MPPDRAARARRPSNPVHIGVPSVTASRFIARPPETTKWEVDVRRVRQVNPDAHPGQPRPPRRPDEPPAQDSWEVPGWCAPPARYPAAVRLARTRASPAADERA